MNLLNKIKYYLVIFMVITFCNSGCKKDSSPAPQNPSLNPGSINGTTNSPCIVSNVYLDTITGAQKMSLVPNSDGTFSFTQVPPGQYTVRIISASPLYLAPSDISVTLTSGQNYSVGELNATYTNAAQTGIINMTFDDTPITIYYDHIGLNYCSNSFFLTGSTSSAPSYYYLEVSIPNSVTGIGTYTMFNNPSYISIFHYTSPGNADGYWSTKNGGVGSLSINYLNTISRAMSGTFSGTLVPQNGLGGSKILTATFDNVVY